MRTLKESILSNDFDIDMPSVDFKDADNEIIRYYIIVDRNNYYDPGNPVWIVELLKTLLEMT